MRYKNTKPMTTEAKIKALIKDALEALRNEHPEDVKLRYYEAIHHVAHQGEPEKDYNIIIQLIGGGRFCGACAIVMHPGLGLWKASMNGKHGFSIGKPWQAMTAPEMLESALKTPINNPDLGKFATSLYPQN